MRRYLDSDEATQERLRGGWLRTGDLAEIDPEGRIELLGRADDRMRSGAEWIHPRELEGVIGRIPGVEEVVVVPVPHPRWGQRPYAFVRTRGLVTEAAFTSAVDALPPFRRPEGVEVLAEFPRLPSGKPDRRGLRARAEAAAEALATPRPK